MKYTFLLVFSLVIFEGNTETFDEFEAYKAYKEQESKSVTDSGLWEDENIVDLDDKTFVSKLKNVDTALVLFYAPCFSLLYHPW